MSDFTLDTVIIGAGVVGLAIGRDLSQIGKIILIIEAEDNLDSGDIWHKVLVNIPKHSDFEEINELLFLPK